MPVSLHRFRPLAAAAVLMVALLIPTSAQATIVRDTQSPFTDVTGWNGQVGNVLTCVESAYTSSSQLTVATTWERNGTPIGSGSAPVTLTRNDYGATFICREHATNTENDVLDAASLPITLVEQPPTLVTQPSVSGTIVAGRAATCAGAVFAGDNLGAISYSWTKTGSGQVGTQQSYTPTRADIGWDLSCRAMVSNPGGSAEGSSSQYSVEDGTPNVDESPKAIGKGTPGLAITCTPGKWFGEGITYSYQWLLNEKPIVGATSQRLIVLDRFVEKLLECRVTATNASGSSSQDSNGISGFAPPILAPLAKVQPALPKLKAAIAKGITNKLVCNASCATESHSAILATDAARLGITGRNIGGFVFIGVGHAKRTYKGELVVTTVFNASAKKGLAKVRKPIRVDLIFETAWGQTYSFKKYHVAASKTVTLRP